MDSLKPHSAFAVIASLALSPYRTPPLLIAGLLLTTAFLCSAGCSNNTAVGVEEVMPPELGIDPAIYRYEIINSTTAEPAMTLMFDTATGALWEMLSDKDGDMVGFGKVEVKSPPLATAVIPGRFRFVPSGAKQTSHYIVDTASGQAWVWAGFNNGRSVFAPIGVEGLSE